ncbi:hypothetical protein LF817_09475 [Halobacillus sp. A1]|uniref:CsxC family protein n=1 Tax=Halobacillus sp. A1 TaxID=2880262 RepID=UPI0020A61EAB|nr:hypothetical protein [Halobacillus sp. A1]MCP3031579.1 hypothetical protein [Halobacillus sp. A1]
MNKYNGNESKGSFPNHNNRCDEAKTLQVHCNNLNLGGGYYLPVALADVEFQALVEAEIELPTCAREIKNVRRNVSLTQCEAIRSITFGGFYSTINVFVSGVIHKNIQYVEDCDGYVRDYSVDVPFSCNQAVRVPFFDTPRAELSQKSTATGEKIFIDKKGHHGDPEKSGGVTFEYYNEPIECRLLFSAVNDLDLYKDYNRRGNFDKITEKAEVVLIFKLLQSRQFPFFPCGEEGAAQTGGELSQNQVAESAQLPGETPQDENAAERINNIIKRLGY